MPRKSPAQKERARKKLAAQKLRAWKKNQRERGRQFL